MLSPSCIKVELNLFEGNSKMFKDLTITNFFSPFQIVRSTSISTMVPVLQNHCRHLPAEFRIMPTPMVPLPPNHVLLYCLCSCGTHRKYFTVHRNVLLDQMARNELITQRVRPLPLIQRLAEMQLHGRSRRYPCYRVHHATTKMDSDEEDIDR